MKNIITIILVMAITLGLSGCGEAESKTMSKEASREMDGEFRYGTWGMTRSEIKELEDAELFNEEEISLVYEGNAVGLNSFITYVFDENQGLYQGFYDFKVKHSNDNNYIVDYMNIKDALVQKYGDPRDEDEQTWMNTIFKNTPERYGTALSAGHLLYSSKWDLEDTEINLLMTGVDYHIRIVLVYLNPERKNSIPQDLTGI